MKRLCLVVSTDPGSGELDRALDLADKANAADIDVCLFFMDHAVAGLPDRRDAVAALVEHGCEVAVCGQSASERNIGADELGLELGGQDDHAAMVTRADCTLAFT